MADEIMTDVEDTNMEVLGNAPAQAMASTYQVLAQSISLSMQNAVSDQAGLSQIGKAIVVVGAVKILEQLK